MFCMRCGQEVPTAAESCPACGQSTKSPEPQATQPSNYGAIPPPPQAQQAGYPPPYRAASSNLKGVAGPLLIFCIFLTMVWPLWTLSQFVLRPGMFRAISSLGLLRMAFGIAVGVSLWVQSRAAIMLLRIYFVVAVALTAWGIVSFATLIMRYSTWHFSMVSGWLIAVVPYALFLVLGIAYFAKSERVRTTYGENLL